MTGPELDLLESGCRGESAYRDPGERVGCALLWENARTNRGQSMRPWAAYVITGNADYVSCLAVRARFLARGIHHVVDYQRYYRLAVPR